MIGDVPNSTLVVGVRNHLLKPSCYVPEPQQGGALEPRAQALGIGICLADAEQQNAKTQGRKEIPFGSRAWAAFGPLRPRVFAFCFFIHLIRQNNYGNRVDRHLRATPECPLSSPFLKGEDDLLLETVLARRIGPQGDKKPWILPRIAQPRLHEKQALELYPPRQAKIEAEDVSPDIHPG
jgi:hypothetical protein